MYSKLMQNMNKWDKDSFLWYCIVLLFLNDVVYLVSREQGNTSFFRNKKEKKDC